jgi:uncharacterized protein YgiB involved in biofilm formation
MIKNKQIKRKNISPAQIKATHTIIGEPQQKRKSRGCLTLVIMGGAAIVALNSCDDKNQTDNDVFYSTVQDCVEAGHSSQVCADAWNNAKADFENTIPKSMTQPACVQQFSRCYFDDAEHSWVPFFGGFLLNQSLRNDRDYSYVAGRNRGYSASETMRRRSSGDNFWGTGAESAKSRSRYTTHTATTVSRGGYGHSSSARGSWGG